MSKKQLWLYWLIPFYPLYKLIRWATKREEKDPILQQLRNVALRSVSHRDAYSTTTVNSDESVRISMKDGSELHTEKRLGDYKTYLYDESGNNTRMHLSDDKVYDDDWKELGYFDNIGEFVSKN